MAAKIFAFGIVFILLLAGAALASSPALITFDVPSKVVSDVPFWIGVNVNAGTIPFTEFDLSFTTTTTPKIVKFETHTPNLFTVHPRTGKYNVGNDVDAGYRYYTTATGTTKISTGKLFELGATAQGLTAVSLNLDETKIKTITASIGYDSLAVSSTAVTFTPGISECGDGVVGYFDANRNGIQEGTEKVEACDDGNVLGSNAQDRYSSNKDGCSADCQFVDIGWTCTNTNFGQRNSACTQKDSKVLFIEKVTAIVNGECYPSPEHPAAFNCDFQIGNPVGTPRTSYGAGGTVSPNTKVKMVSSIGSALAEFFWSLRPT